MTKKTHKINAILASHNEGKLSELQTALEPLGWKLQSLNECNLPIPDETGSTFDANAHIKAHAACVASGVWALADDSGLEVNALDGAPGVDTANYGGWSKLLKALQNQPSAQRGARFICVLALARPNTETIFFRGICDGEIATEARGDGGFGYDPVFIPCGETRTFAEMTKAEKSLFSHRGKALRAFIEWAEMLIAEDTL